jgi:ABC-2 type transport system permease protein
MSTTVVAPRSDMSTRSGKSVTLGRVLRSEWTKLWSLRSTRWSLLAAVIGMAGLGAIVGAFQMNHWPHMDPHERAHFNSIDTGVGGYHLAQLAIAVLGVLVITGEYSTGMIRSSLLAVPRRLPVLWAKLLTYSAVTFVLMLAASFISFFAVQAIVKQRHLQHSISDPHALRAIFGTALFLTVLGALCIGLGALIRNTAGGIAAFVGLLFVLPGVFAILPASINDSVSPYLPVNAGTAAATVSFDNPHHLAPWTGLLVFCAYAVVTIGLAAIALVRRDA